MRELRTEKAATLSQDRNRFQQFEKNDFECLYRSYRGFVHRTCLRMLRSPVEAEDATQDVFVRVFCKMHTYRGDSAFSSWLYRLTINTVLMQFRKKKRAWTQLDLDETTETGIESSRWRFGDLPRLIDLQAAIDLLPQGYKSAFVLHDVHGYRHREIAKILGYSVGSSKSQLHRARKRLRTLLNGSRIEKTQMQRNCGRVSSEVCF
jgi:RNA polymerase sigma-70 factor, ECF subfamily